MRAASVRAPFGVVVGNPQQLVMGGQPGLHEQRSARLWLRQPKLASSASYADSAGRGAVIRAKVL